MGAAACMKRTFATDVWFSARRKAPEEIARNTVIASPHLPMPRNARTVRRRSIATTKRSSAIAAKNARPATCVAASASSPRCARPAVDHATAARTIASWPSRARRRSRPALPCMAVSQPRR